ncbi:MAG: alpha/beta hydrolase [Thiotrichaceae bacterium]
MNNLKPLKHHLCMSMVLCAVILLAGCSSLPVTWEARVEGKNLPPEIKLNYKEQGSVGSGNNGEVVLLLHGFAESSYTWRYLEDDLAKTHRVINLDLKGFGDSPKPRDGRYSIYDQAVAVKHFIKQQKLKRITLVGHSLGGGIALALTLMAENEPWVVERLILIDAAAYQQNLPSMIRDLSTPIIGELGVYLIPARIQAKQAYTFAFYNDKKIPKEGIEYSARSFSKPGARYVFLQSAKQLIPEDIEKISRQYTTIKQPSLIIWGYHDVVVPRRFARRLHNDLQHSDLRLIHHAGHMPHEETPATVLRLIQRFFAKEDN